MSGRKHQIVILSSGRRIEAEAGQTLLEALARAGIQLRADCGGKGVCGKCQVRSRRLPPGADLEGEDSPLEERQACQVVVASDLGIDIPVTSLAHAEVIAKPTFVRRFQVAGEPPAPGANLGLAVDLGTTTIAVFLCDLERQVVLASGAVRNPQVICGDDVMSRISAVSTDETNLGLLQELVVSAIDHAVGRLVAQVGVAREQIQRMVVVGNSTMIHLLLGVDPSPIGVFPYDPVFAEARDLAAADLGFQLHPQARVQTLPLISGFLGADIIAATLATDVGLDGDRTMLIDVGTNGEVMLDVGGGLSGTSCATGPALEGAAISHGMHAVSGAISAVEIDPDSGAVRCQLIQHNPDEPQRAVGICGSGIVSAVAALVEAGIVLPSGSFNRDCGHPRLRMTADGVAEFVLVEAESTQTGTDITLTQKDIRAVQLAKGAILTGITLLCREARIDLPRRLLIAGAFGSFLDKRDAITIGMLPPLALKAIETVGNAAGEGAIMALLDEGAAGRALEIARRTRVVDLAAHPDFQEVFVSSLSFPEPTRVNRARMTAGRGWQ